MSINRDNRRHFRAAVKREAWKRCNGRCESCPAPVTAGNVNYDHIVPWELSRDSSLGNCQVLCNTCHRYKTSSVDVPAIADAKAASDFHLGIKGPGLGSHPLPAGRRSAIMRTMAGRVAPRPAYGERHWRYMRTKCRGWLEI